MLDPTDQVSGRRRAIDLVRSIMERPEVAGVPRSQGYPVLVLEGTRGSGKTALLDNTDVTLGWRFVNQSVQSRRQYAAEETGHPDPMTVGGYHRPRRAVPRAVRHTPCKVISGPACRPARSQNERWTGRLPLGSGSGSSLSPPTT